MEPVTSIQNNELQLDACDLNSRQGNVILRIEHRYLTL